MSETADVVAAAFDRLVPSVPRALSGVLDAIGMSTKELAGHFGLSTRTVQRWRVAALPAAERRGRQFRNPMRTARGEELRTLAAASLRARVVAEIRRKGVIVRTFSGDVLVSKEARSRDVTDVKIPRGLVQVFCTVISPPPDWERGAEELANAWGIAYGIGPGVQWEDLDELELEIPAREIRA